MCPYTLRTAALLVSGQEILSFQPPHCLFSTYDIGETNGERMVATWKKTQSITLQVFSAQETIAIV